MIFIIELRVSWSKCCWDCLNLLPQVREFLIFEWWGGFETTIGAVVFERSAAGQEFHHQNFIFLFLFFNFLGTFYVLPWAVILYFGKSRHQIGWSWLEGSVLWYAIEVHAGLRFRTEMQDWRSSYVMCFQVELPSVHCTSKHKLIWSNLVNIISSNLE